MIKKLNPSASIGTVKDLYRELGALVGDDTAEVLQIEVTEEQDLQARKLDERYMTTHRHIPVTFRGIPLKINGKKTQ